MGCRVAIDIGGTFTDVVLCPDGERVTDLVSTKVLTSHRAPANAALDGLAAVLSQAGLQPSDVSLVLHGTTLATNALIERRGAVTALLCTEGHRDALEMAFENRFEQYDIGIDRPQPLVPRVLRLPVRERLAADGEVLLPLELTSLDALLPTLDSHGVEAVAVSLLHEYVNPAHTERVASRLAQLRPTLSITLGSEVCPEIREYERASTACANAYVRPLMDTYLGDLESRLHALGARCPVLLMTSGGGLTTLATARRFPIRLVESGPAGGAVLAQALCKQVGLSDVLSFDMGGTTAKLCLLDRGKPTQSRSFEVDRSYRFKKGSGLPVRIPVIEMVEIGAGGGSIAQRDALGRLRVGPQSAGSDPGPACYGLGGTQPTVTDADVALGLVPPDGFAGGRFELDASAAERALARLADEQAVSELAAALRTVVDESMAAAARAHAAESGAELSRRTLIAFGGAAPVHAASLAERLSIDRVLVPPGAGVGSAVGFLLAPIAFEVVRSSVERLSAYDESAAEARLVAMQIEAESVVRPADPHAQWLTERRVAMRYAGQGSELFVALPEPTGDALAPTQAMLRAGFEQAYERLYGRLVPGVDCEILSWMVNVGQVKVPGLPPERREATPAREVSARSIRRDALAAGELLPGPSLVREDQTTTVVPAGWSARLRASGVLELNRGEPT